MPRNELGELAVKVATVTAEIASHKDECSRRYGEAKEQTEKVLKYLMTTNDKIDAIKDVLAEQRGAGKLAKIMTQAGAGAMGLLGGLGGSHFLK